MERIKMSKLGLIVGLLLSVVFSGGCIPAGADEGTSTIYMIIFLVLLFALMYFLMIRPQRKRRKEHQELIQELKRGDKVITAGGIYGVIESTGEDSIIIKVESGATMRVARNSVALKREG